MQVKFGTDGKRINSTKIPTLTDTKTCVLKRPCTVEAPVLDLSEFNPRWSVAYIPDFHRYYFVTNIESISNSITRYHLTVDALASFKERVLAHTLYVVRSQNMGSNKLVDPYATHTADNPNIYHQTFSIGNFSQTGSYILQTVGGGTSTSIGQGVNTYIVTAAQLRTLSNALFQEATYSAAGVTVAGAEKTFFNPFQYIVNCRWFPVDSSAISQSTGAEAVRFGWFYVSANAVPAHLVTGNVVISNTDFSLPSLVDWTASSPDYSRYALHVPGFGTMEIDPAFAGLSLYCHIVVDLLTGGARCEIREKTGEAYSTLADPVLSSASGYWGVDVMLTQLSSDASNLASNAINGIMSGLSGGEMSATDLFTAYYGSGAAGQTDTGLTMALSALDMIPFVGSAFKKGMQNLLQPSLNVNGAVGNTSEFLNIEGKLRLTVKHYDVLEPNMNDVAGLPCNRKMLLSNLTGYTVCNNASVSIASATASAKLAIKKHLEGGFWIE